MHLRTFSAPSMAKALMQVKSELGADAVILHTRTLQRKRWLGLRRQEFVEITAGTGMNVAARAPRRQPAPAAAAPAIIRPSASSTQRASRLPGSPSRVADLVGARADSAPSPQNLLQTPAANTAMLSGLANEVDCLKSMLQDLVRETRSQRAPNIPEDLFEHYLHLIQNQVAEELAGELVKNLHLRPDHLKNRPFVREKLAEQLEKMLPVSGPIVRSKKDGPHVVALIGPTGVGKTTTIAKLAANLKLREQKKVGLITIDTYRIAAVDQLKKYADIIGSALKVVNSPEDLREAVRSMGDCDFVLIDTAGRSPTDAMRLRELRGFLELVKPDEVHLVLSSTASQPCIESAIARFSEVRVDKIIFTKLDEAVHVGVVFNVIKKVNKALSYVTTGQDVPNDIEVGQPRRLAQRLLKGDA